MVLFKTYDPIWSTVQQSSLNKRCGPSSSRRSSSLHLILTRPRLKLIMSTQDSVGCSMARQSCVKIAILTLKSTQNRTINRQLLLALFRYTTIHSAIHMFLFTFVSMDDYVYDYVHMRK